MRHDPFRIQGRQIQGPYWETSWFEKEARGIRDYHYGVYFQLQEKFDKRDKESTDNLPAWTLFPAKGCQIALKSQVK
jgi:hypothetical protein